MKYAATSSGPWVRGLATAALAIAGWMALPAQAAQCTASNEVACTEGGAVRGAVDGPSIGFKAIPYARPPVAALRWRGPQPAAPWSGVRDGSQYADMCPQQLNGKVVGSEDCLYVNVWRPLAKPDHPLPVMVWLHGGGNYSYSGAGSPGFGKVVYNGRAMVPEGVVFVTYNLRLGALGFLAHPSLDAENPDHISGNYGSQDQIAMLAWVHRNIAAFGGDPNHVFLFGTSAGGGNICALMTSPKTRGLIHGVSMQSSVPSGCEIPTLADVERGTGTTLPKLLGCDGQGDVAACMRGKSPEQLVNAIPTAFTVFPRTYGPNMDGHVFVDQPIELIKRRAYPAMPVMIGNTSEETQHFIDAAGPVTDQATLAGAVTQVFGAQSTPRILAEYPAGAYASPRAAFVKLTTDGEFTCQSRRVARTFASVQSEPVFRYRFSYALQNDAFQKSQGAIHTVEHPFLFSWQGSYKPTDTELTMQRQMIGYWSRMARNGNPNGGNAVPWPAVTPQDSAYLEMGPQMQAAAGPADAHCDFWDTVTLPWPHM
ncbi:MAG: hypothetical protein JWR56_753 [Massilia sp.]|nr:hypothetical protein [Massilia sp.]